MGNHEEHRIALDEFRRRLGPEVVGRSDVEIERLREWEERFAAIFFDWWLKRRNLGDALPVPRGACYNYRRTQRPQEDPVFPPDSSDADRG